MNTLTKIKLSYKTIPLGLQFFQDKIGLLSGDTLYKTHQSLQFLCRSSTPDIDEIIVVTSGFAYPLEYVHVRNPIIVDLGAHIGTFSIYANNYYKNNCKIYAYEPSPENFKYLTMNLLLNNMSIKSFQIGISTKKGKAYMTTEGVHTDEYKLSYAQRSIKDTQCSITTMERILVENHITSIDVLKMDIEGTEHDLLNNRNTRQIIETHVRNLFIECHTESADRNIDSLLRLLTPAFNVIVKRDSVFLLRNSLHV